ncbi:MAG: hypothetical protein MJZ87_07180, partial [Bacteroidales bacterium]|nr:hypothetical protein [Bacteroidales bacterium]
MRYAYLLKFQLSGYISEIRINIRFSEGYRIRILFLVDKEDLSGSRSEGRRGTGVEGKGKECGWGLPRRPGKKKAPSYEGAVVLGDDL